MKIHAKTVVLLALGSSLAACSPQGSTVARPAALPPARMSEAQHNRMNEKAREDARRNSVVKRSPPRFHGNSL